MSMFCFQCEETARGVGCDKRGVCGKDERTSNLMDLLIYALEGIALSVEKSGAEVDRNTGVFLARALFATITNANFDEGRILTLVHEALDLRETIKAKGKVEDDAGNHGSMDWWTPADIQAVHEKAAAVSPLSFSDNEDIRSLKALVLYGLKGVAAYTDHAAVLGHYDDEIFRFIVRALAALTREGTADELTALVLQTGETAVRAMALLDKANTSAYGNPEITRVNIGVGKNPGILISGHDLKDMEELLKQTDGTGVDVYTHSEMLPANYYPAFKKYRHFVGNYGSSWWNQGREFEAFNGPVLMTTNCITPVKDSYKNRIFTTGMAGYPGVKHLPDREEGKEKDFSEIVALAKTCPPPRELEKGAIVGGFAHDQVMRLADKIVAAVKDGKIRKFVVMAGCDGRKPNRNYFTEVAKALPADTVILTAGCAKYRYNKLNLGDIDGIPRVLDAGQCNDSYSLAFVALKLKEVFGVSDINDLPIVFDIAWYEQKAVCVLLALLHLGFKGIMLGPTLPAFVSPNVAAVLVEKFGIKPIGEVAADVKALTGAAARVS